MAEIKEKLPTTPEAWAFALAEASNAAMKAGARADLETFLPVIQAIRNQVQRPLAAEQEIHRLRAESQKNYDFGSAMDRARCRLLNERNELRDAIIRWAEASAGMEANWAARDLEALAKKLKQQPTKEPDGGESRFPQTGQTQGFGED